MAQLENPAISSPPGLVILPDGVLVVLFGNHPALWAPLQKGEPWLWDSPKAGNILAELLIHLGET